jgi:hypothetical protein
MVIFKSELLKIITKLEVPLLGYWSYVHLIEDGIKINKDYILDVKMTLIDIISLDYISTTNKIIEHLNKNFEI